MIPIVTIVEGEGEVAAVPVLLRRLAAEWHPTTPTAVLPLPPIRVRRDRFLNREEEFRRQLLLAAAKSGENGWILIILDADDDCPATLGKEIQQRARQYIPHRRLSVVLPMHEYEAWFLASASSLQGTRGFQVGAKERIDPEGIRNIKGWMSSHMGGSDQAYKEVRDQPAFTARIDLRLAHQNSRSFRKLCKEWDAQIGGRS